MTFAWAQGGDHFGFEQNFQLSFGYPAVMAISPTKMKYTIMKASYSEKEFVDFTSGILSGKSALIDFKDYGKISTVTEWDGKDAAPPKDDL
jgi:protein disulfide-isomerase A6